MPVRYTSIYTGENGVSHFREMTIELAETILGPGIPPLGASSHLPAKDYYFLTFPPGMLAVWHPSPGRLFHFFLAGNCEVTVEDGETRTFQQGDIVLAEDTRGRGHITRNPGPQETLMVVVTLPAEIHF